MTNYEQLKKKICEALPRLMDDVVGQNYEHGIIYYRAVDFYENGLFLMNFNADVKFFELSEIANSFTKLGIEPTLSDVLEFLNSGNDFTFFISSTGRVFKSPIYEGFAKYKACFDWNLSQPLLKDQSEELIDYLLGL